jgi:serine/threonine-protein kinase
LIIDARRAMDGPMRTVSISVFGAVIGMSLIGCAAAPGSNNGDAGAVDLRHHHPDAPFAVDAPTTPPGTTDARQTADAQPPPATDGGSTACGTGGHSPYGPDGAWFLTDVTCTPKAASSDAMIAALAAEGGWGNGNKMQIDTAIDVLTADASTPMQTFTPNSDFYSPDCDHVAMPVPVGGNIEGNTGYACNDNGDCHLLVHAPNSKTLYEMYRANITSSGFSGGCLAVWDESRVYGPQGRGEQCTSADAAGFPIAPLLFTADEVAAGHIDHAIRFILPNDRVRKGFVTPATHGTNTTGIANAPYYGVHLRLRADYPIDSLPTEGAKVVARAMQRYGMYHADGGNIALTAQSDRHTTHKWSGLLGSQDLAALKVTDFEVIDHGSYIPLTGDCVRAP